MFDGKFGQAGDRVDAQLLHDVSTVSLDGLLTDVQGFGDVAGLFPIGEKRQDLDLAIAEFREAGAIAASWGLGQGWLDAGYPERTDIDPILHNRLYAVLQLCSRRFRAKECGCAAGQSMDELAIIRAD